MNRDDATASLNYASAGVDISAGNTLVERIKSAVRTTHRPGVIGGIGGFGGLFELPLNKYTAPVLVSGTDGVGTKLRLAIDHNQHQHIGIDLVAMCVNDIVVTGAEPLFFLDYYATGKLDVDQATTIIESIAEGCRQAGAALIGGETAEMPGMYAENDYDLGGFAVGIVEKSDIIDGHQVSAGDAVLGLASSGPHANGYSLIRAVIKHSGATADTAVGDTRLIDALLRPTRIYVKAVRSVLEQCPIHALAHITGGGLLENIPRILPGQLSVRVQRGSWPRPAVFDWLQRAGNIDPTEMYRVFNCGIGMIVIVPEKLAGIVVAEFEKAGELAWRIGSVFEHAPECGSQVIID